MNDGMIPVESLRLKLRIKSLQDKVGRLEAELRHVSKYGPSPSKDDQTKIASGSLRGAMSKRIVIAFDDETFDVIRLRAVIRKTSFAEQVRQLVEWGLEFDDF